MSEKYGAEGMTVILDELTDEKLSSFADISARYALYKLDNFTYSSCPSPDLRLEYDNSEDDSSFVTEVNKSIYDLMNEGNTSTDHWSGRELRYDKGENATYTLSSWKEALKSACEERGLNISFGEIKDFTFNQTDAWDVSVNFTIEINVTDGEGRMELKKNLTANASFPIDGFVDPMIACESTSRSTPGNASERQVFRSATNYTVPADASPILLRHEDDVVEGKGWFFGNVTDKPCDYNETKAKLNVLVTPYFDTMDCPNGTISLAGVADSFGGVIVTTVPQWNMTNSVVISNCNYTTYRQTGCLDCLNRTDGVNITPGAFCPSTAPQLSNINLVNVPFIAVDGDNWLNDTPADKYGDKHVLFDNEHELKTQDGYHRIWNMEPLRDLVLCGYYVEAGEAPSFLQRFTKTAAELSAGEYDMDFGIETFVEGRWAGGDYDTDHESCSRVDHNFYHNYPTTCVEGTRIKGMPGCKSKDMCTDSPADPFTAQFLGRFRMDDYHMTAYSNDSINNVTLISCNDGLGSSCD